MVLDKAAKFVGHKNKDAMETNEKISQLQGLRGVAMLGIFIMHTFVFYTDSGGQGL